MAKIQPGIFIDLYLEVLLVGALVSPRLPVCAGLLCSCIGVSCLLREDGGVTSIRQVGSLKPQVKVRELRVGQVEIPS